MLGIDLFILCMNAKIIVFTTRYISRRHTAGGGEMSAMRERLLLKKFSSDCAASYFSLYVTKIQQFECAIIGKSESLCNRGSLLSHFDQAPSKFQLQSAEDGPQRHLRFELLLPGRTALPKGKMCRFSALSPVRKFADHQAI
jgi:hypothetical protein